MAEETKNKASKGWISKACNCVKRMREDKEFWGRIVIVVGFIAFTNSFNASMPAFWVNLIFGIVFMLLGILIAPKKTLKFWAGILITLGVSGFFFFNRIRSFMMPTFSGVAIAFSLMMTAAGLCLCCRDKVDSGSKERGQGES